LAVKAATKKREADAKAREKAAAQARAAKAAEVLAAKKAREKGAADKLRAKEDAKKAREAETLRKQKEREAEVARKIREKEAIESAKRREIETKQRANEKERLRRQKEMERRELEERKRREREEAIRVKAEEELARKRSSKPYTDDQAFLDEIKATLVAELEITNQQVTALDSQADELLVDREHVEFDGESNMDFGTDFDREQVKEHAERLRDKSEQITVALQLVAERSYGRCDNCYERIPKDRLRFQIPAFLCTSCRVFF
jgi:RNA polymerase-binding transcription factor DksA